MGGHFNPLADGQAIPRFLKLLQIKQLKPVTTNEV